MRKERTLSDLIAVAFDDEFKADRVSLDLLQIQKASGIADRWEQVQADNPKEANPFMGCEDLNETASI